MKKVGLYTLGCKLNFSETSTIGRQFEEHGFTRVNFNEPADVYVINTCSVTENADKKCRKVVREALKHNAEASIVIVGCYAQLKPEEIANIPGVDLVLGANEKFRMFELVSEFVKEKETRIIAGDVVRVKEFVDAYSIGDRTRSFLKIQDGCDYKCTFCTIPQARGESRSDSISNIITNAKKLADDGVKEIVLTGVNIGDFGKGTNKKFVDVVRALDETEGIARIRISSIEPNLLTNEIIDIVAKSDKFMPHFHVPLQSGNDEILAMMRRRYMRDLYAERVSEIRRQMPHACIGVDVITGFPGENESHFLDTYQFVNELDVNYLHVFTYSERANTFAADMPESVPQKIRSERTQMLRILSEKKKNAFYRKYVGQIRSVLFEEEVSEGKLLGWSDNYVRVSVPYEPLLINEIVPVTLCEMAADGTVSGDYVEVNQLHS